MTYTLASVRRADAMPLDDLCDPRFTLHNPPRPFALFGGVVDTPEVTAARREVQNMTRPSRTCAAPNCHLIIGTGSRTKTCRQHRHGEFCQCLNCKKVVR